MKKLLLLTLLFFSINGFAFNWKIVAEGESGNSLYVDVDNLKKQNGLVYYWRLMDLLEPIKGSLGNANSNISKFKVNCVEEKQTWLNSTHYSQSMGKGRIVIENSPNKIEYPKLNTVGHTTMKFACDNAK